MHRIITFLKDNLLINLSLILIYYIAVVVLHDEVGAMINGSFDSITRDSYNNIILVATILGGCVMGILLFKRYKVHPRRQLLTLLLVYSLVAIVTSFSILFVINIEAIHFVQYAILAILIYPLTQSATATMILGTIAGAVDELYQYLVIDTSAKYYDFNDVFLDSVGLGLGLLCIAILGMAFVKRQGSWYKRAECVLLIIIVTILIVLAFLGEFHINLDPNAPAGFTLFKMAPQGFWHYPGGPYARFHILTPIPGLLLIGLTNWVYARLDK